MANIDFQNFTKKFFQRTGGFLQRKVDDFRYSNSEGGHGAANYRTRTLLKN